MLKYKSINGWTKAKMIEKVMEYVPKKEPCVDGFGCTYQNDAGQRCAVGAFIPNDLEETEEMLDFPGSVTRLADHIGIFEDLMPLDLSALSKLQNVHDSFDDGNGYGTKFCANLNVDGPQAACVAWIEKMVHDD